MPENKPAMYIGLMSGTSADSIDAALVNFESGKPNIIATHSHQFHDMLKEQIFELFEPGPNEIDKLGMLDRHLGEAFASATSTLLQEAGVQPSDVRAIGSHGQTIRHRPHLDKDSVFSLQIGDPNTIAQETGITTIADFRRRDIAAGGQGAPLTPAFHEAFFRSHDEDRCILNIGGIANITHLPKEGKILGFDTGPGNGLMDGCTRQYKGEAFDNNGTWAESGNLNQTLLNKMLSYDYFSKPAPKSTGKEEFNMSWLQGMTQNLSLIPEDIQATLLELTAQSISKEINQLCEKPSHILVCGGGSHNDALMKRLKALLRTHRVETTQACGVDPDWVEATAFAWLAMRTMNNLTSNLPDVTGASREVILGAIYPA